jgi:V/A-type H+-transporting ATPase subunit A
MEFHARAKTCIKLGAPLSKITDIEVPLAGRGAVAVREGLSRLKSAVKNDDLSALDDFERGMRRSLEELERSYRAREIL